jgi:hypothetical protein
MWDISDGLHKVSGTIYDPFPTATSLPTLKIITYFDFAEAIY